MRTIITTGSLAIFCLLAIGCADAGVAWSPSFIDFGLFALALALTMIPIPRA